jgi:NhaP-type Na+/H+ or K+/H+ antiporter
MIELAGILVLGIFAQWLAWKIKFPAILPLIVIGLLVGPVSTVLTPSGEKLIDGDSIFSGQLLFSFVSLSVGLILFEGGLTLKIREVQKLVGALRNLLTIGVLVTFICSGFAAYYLVGLNLKIAFLFAALIIVTGPTVIGPILRNVRPNANINTVLKWEGILIDPIGALIAVLVFGFVKAADPGTEYYFTALKNFFITISTGVFIGALAAFILYYLLRKNRIAFYLRNVVALAIVILAFALSELLLHESGLIVVTVMGVILANLKLEEIKKVFSFKEDLSLILVSVLFILLSSRINLDQISKLGVGSIVLFFVVTLLIRPLSVFISTVGSGLSVREKLFISWIGPRGIVAAAVASLFSLELLEDPREGDVLYYQDAEMLLPLVFLIIVGTVVIQGTTAKVVAKWLKVEREDPQGILFLGAHEAARMIATYLSKRSVPVLMSDTSSTNLNECMEAGLPVLKGDILRDNLLEEIDLSHMGKLFALTPNTEINSLACKKLKNDFGEENALRLISRREIEIKGLDKPKHLLFAEAADYNVLIQTVRSNADIKEEPVNTVAELETFLNKRKNKIIPLCTITLANKANVISGFGVKVYPGDKLIYIDGRAPVAAEYAEYDPVV